MRHLEIHREIVLTLERGIKEGHTSENVTLELNTLKFANNLNFCDLRAVAVPTLLNLVKPGFSIKDVMARWGDVLKKLIFDEEDQADLLKLVEVYSLACRSFFFWNCWLLTILFF